MTIHVIVDDRGTAIISFKESKDAQGWILARPRPQQYSVSPPINLVGSV